VLDNRPDELLADSARVAWQLRLALAWTDGLGSKVCSRTGSASWKRAAPLSVDEGAAVGFFTVTARRRNPVVAARASGLVLVEADLSVPDGAYPPLTEVATRVAAMFTRLDLWFPESVIVQSRRGFHFYLRPDGGCEPAKVQLSEEGDAVMWSSDGYVVGVPGQHELPGVVYRYVRNGEIATLPIETYLSLRALAYATQTEVRSAFETGGSIPVGSRRETMFSIALERFRAGVEREAIVEQLLAVNQAQCDLPLSAAQVRAQIDGAIRWAEKHPTETERARVHARRILNGDQAGSNRPDIWAESVRWEIPVPLTTRRAVPTFPINALPHWLADWACEVSREKGATVDLAATLALGVVAGALARHVQVSPRPGWWEPVNLYLAVALEPGQRKSPIFKQALRPVRLLERDLAAVWQEHQALAVLSAEILQKRRRELIAAAADDDELDNEELSRRMEEMAGGLDEPDPPPPPRLLTEDVTAEGLASLLAQHGRIIAASDEGAAIFENFAGRYSRGSSSWDLFNKAHAGVDVAVDRKSTGAVIVLDPALTLVIATQPSVLRDLWSKPGTEGRGVLARPLYSLPEPMFATGRTPAADGAVLADFERRVRALFADIPTLLVDEEHRPRPVTLTLDPAAERIFELYEFELASRRRDLGVSDRAEEEGAYLGWLSKLAGQTARLAAVLHAAKHWTDGTTLNTTIGRRTVDSAVALARYFDDNALAVFGLMGEMPNQRLARAILGWLSNRPANELAGLTVRDVHRSRGHGVTAEQVHAALRLLETHGFVRLQSRSPATQGGRPSTHVRVNPSIPARPQSDRQNRHNHPRGGVLSVASAAFEGDEKRDGTPAGPADRPIHRNARCAGTGAWLARDRGWRCTACDPPAFPAEVLERRDPYTDSSEGDKQ
jgi:replicative DNA helicase